MQILIVHQDRLNKYHEKMENFQHQDQNIVQNDPYYINDILIKQATLLLSKVEHQII